MNLNDLRTSKFLKQSDVGQGVLATISRLERQNVAPDGDEPDEKVTVYFNELDKPLVLNSTNGHLIAKISGHDTDIEKNWVGLKIVLYVDPNVSYGGRVVGGIRVRAPKPGSAAAKKPVQEEDLPF